MRQVSLSGDLVTNPSTGRTSFAGPAPAFRGPLRHLVGAMVFACALGAVVFAPTPAQADPATDKARSLYETGLQLFYAREHAQALIEFQRAHEVKPRPATLFMMGQCEYLLGALRQARDHYEAYLRDSPRGEFVEVAKDRVESINRRPATLVINTVPDQVDVRITAEAPGATAPTNVPAAPVPANNPGPSTFAGGSNPPPKPPPAANGPSTSVITGQAPNNFAVPRGRWVVAVSKPHYQPQKLTVELDLAETRPLFFKLEPIAARLEIETLPSGATLYVNGNRARNPYGQDVPPGHYEIFAEATNYDDRAQELNLGPGERRRLTGPDAFRLRYVQRSGRPELLFASTVMGGFIGAGAVAGTVVAAQASSAPGSVATVSLSLGGAFAGTIGGALLANRFVPAYIPDNRALFMIGGMWVGAAQGALVGMTIGHARQPRTIATEPGLGSYQAPAPASTKLQYAFFGSLPGFALGATASALMMNRAPTYGRVALIQSAAIGGAMAGGLVAVALRWNPFGWQQVTQNRDKDGNVIDGEHLEDVAEHSIMDLALPAFIGLNVGLAAGLLGAYLPDQSRYGPSWERIALIDLAASAGALAAGVGACVADDRGCLTSQPDSAARARTAAIALAGGVAGLAAGILLTRNVDADIPGAAAKPPLDVAPATPPPTVTVVPMPNGRGGLMPMLSAVGFF